ncbi:hypothetical protein V5F31_05730 [Xanthobacter sp. V7C-4]|uniref:hypothetical protein n=1 Tax=Xanthobacter autotrophicus (strain ATCC BAA-1158 / Py2) TaxID=78245 RepID=UPI0037277232
MAENSSEAPAEIPPEKVIAMLAGLAAQEGDGAPWGWPELSVFCPTSSAVMAQCVAYGATAQFVQFFGEAGLDPHKFDAFCSAPPDARQAIVEYVMQRGAGAEALFNKMQEWGAARGRTFDDLEPFERAGIELVTRIVPAVVATIAAMNAETRRRTPPPAPPAARPIPLDETSLEEMPAFGERMEG